MAAGEEKVSLMTYLDTVPDDAKIYVVKPGDTTPYYTTKAALLSGIAGGTTPGINAVLTVDDTVTNQDQIFQLSATQFIKINRAAQRIEFWNTAVDAVNPMSVYSLGSVTIRRSSDNVNSAHDANSFYIEDPDTNVAVSIGVSEGIPEFGLTNDTNNTGYRVGVIINDGVLYLLPTGASSPLATQLYVDDKVAGLLDLRGNHDASSNTFPTTGGSGTAGAILKGDLWLVSVAGVLNGVAVNIGDSFYAKIDSPTSSDWSVLESNLGYVAENAANKTDTMTGNEASSTKYLSAKGVYDWIGSLGYATASAVTAALGFKADKSTSAYSKKVNKTSATADEVEVPYRSDGWQTYTDTVTATGTLNGTPTQTYKWRRDDDCVEFWFNSVYSSAGATITQLQIPMPSDLPNPLVPNGFTGASVVLFIGTGQASASLTTVTPSASDMYSAIRRNSGDNDFEFIINTASAAYISYRMYIKYPIS